MSTWTPSRMTAGHIPLRYKVKGTPSLYRYVSVVSYLALLLPSNTGTLTLPDKGATDVTIGGHADVTTRGRSSYRAAVYEHRVVFPVERQKPVPRSTALELMDRNLAVYETQAMRAKLQNADILVFPEDGIYGMQFTRDALYPYLESIPDPTTVTWSPCADPTRYSESQVQHRLSCMAANNSMYVVANMGDKVACDVRKDPSCPEDGRYQYNTVVVFDPEGTLVSKYHKRHLFYESQFDQPKVAEAKFFDTPFGRFGMVVCFDLLFRDPAVTLVEDHGVTDVLFPTAWMDALPLLSAIGFHSSFARLLKVNLLAANIHFPLLKFHGSGVYTPEGMASFFYDNILFSPGKLLVSDIKVISKPPGVPKQLASSRNPHNDQNKAYKHEHRLISKQKEFQSEVFHDLFTFRTLEDAKGEIRVCDKAVCCYLKYEKGGSRSLFENRFAFGAFDGLHTFQGQYYLQVCTLVKCANSLKQSSCGDVTYTSLTKFKSLEIRGEFQTPHVFPQVVLSSNGQLQLANAEEWNFTSSDFRIRGAHDNGARYSGGGGGGGGGGSGGVGGQDKSYNFTISSAGFSEPVLSATLFGRFYSHDNSTTDVERVTNEESVHSPEEITPGRFVNWFIKWLSPLFYKIVFLF